MNSLSPKNRKPDLAKSAVATWERKCVNAGSSTNVTSACYSLRSLFLYSSSWLRSASLWFSSSSTLPPMRSTHQISYQCHPLSISHQTPTIPGIQHRPSLHILQQVKSPSGVSLIRQMPMWSLIWLISMMLFLIRERASLKLFTERTIPSPSQLRQPQRTLNLWFYPIFVTPIAPLSSRPSWSKLWLEWSKMMPISMLISLTNHSPLSRK